MTVHTSGAPLCIEFRTVRSSEELAQACALASGLILEVPDSTDQVAYIQSRYPEDQSLLFVAHALGDMIGAGLGIRKYGAVLVALLGVQPEYRNLGIARRFLELIEIEAMRIGAGMISLGAVESAQAFYRRVGYSGKSSYHKQLPSPSRVLEHRLNRLSLSIGNLAEGATACTDKSTGKLPRVL
jgi:predicted N-acetyltransferase YhbS